MPLAGDTEPLHPHGRVVAQMIVLHGPSEQAAQGHQSMIGHGRGLGLAIAQNPDVLGLEDRQRASRQHAGGGPGRSAPSGSTRGWRRFFGLRVRPPGCCGARRDREILGRQPTQGSGLGLVAAALTRRSCGPRWRSVASRALAAIVGRLELRGARFAVGAGRCDHGGGSRRAMRPRLRYLRVLGQGFMAPEV